MKTIYDKSFPSYPAAEIIGQKGQDVSIIPASTTSSRTGRPTPIPIQHFEILERLIVEIPSLKKDFEFCILRLRLFAQQEAVGLDQLTDLFYECLKLPDQTSKSILHAFNVNLIFLSLNM